MNKVPIIQNLHLLPLSIYCHRLQWIKSGTMLGFDCGYVYVGTHIPDYMANNSQCPLEFHISHQWCTEKNCSWTDNYHWIRTILFDSLALHSSNWPNFLKLSYVTDRIFHLCHLNSPAQPPWMCRNCIPPKCHNILTTMWCTNAKEDHDTCGITLQETVIVMSTNGIEMNAVSISAEKKKLGIMYNKLLGFDCDVCWSNDSVSYIMQFPPSGWQLYAKLLEQFWDMMQLNPKSENFTLHVLLLLCIYILM